MRRLAGIVLGAAGLLGAAGCGSVVPDEPDGRLDAPGETGHPEDGTATPDDATGDAEPGTEVLDDVGDAPPDELDAGPCVGDLDCDDGDPCNGVEECLRGACLAGIPLLDGTTCSPAGGPASDRGTCLAGSCVCINETVCYRDGDDDGFGTVSDWSCAAACSGDWVSRPGDCCDLDGAVHPGATAWQTGPYNCGEDGLTPSFDYDCDGTEEQEYPATATGRCAVADLVCLPIVPGWCETSSTTGNLETLCPGTSIPECGQPGPLVTGCVEAGKDPDGTKATACRFESAERLQGCR